MEVRKRRGRVYMTTGTVYQGVEIVESDSNVLVRHPRWGYENGKMTPLNGASLLFLADETWLVVCDECGYNGITGREPYVTPEGEYKAIVKQADGLLAHINGMHHKNKSNRTSIRYTDDQIKAIIKIWLKWRATGIRTWAQAACDELESLGFKPYISKQWSPGQVGVLVRRYVKDDKFKNIKAGSMMDDNDREALSKMIREAAAREGVDGRSVVASNVRITEREKRQEVEEDVLIGNDDGVSPTLSFAGLDGDSDLETKTLVVAEKANVHSLSTPKMMTSPSATHSTSDFIYIADLPDGTPMFTYKGTLMVGRVVKDVQI